MALTMSGDILGCHKRSRGGGCCLISNKKRPGMQLNILQCTDRPHSKRIFIQLQCQQCWGWELLHFYIKQHLTLKYTNHPTLSLLIQCVILPRVQSTVLRSIHRIWLLNEWFWRVPLGRMTRYVILLIRTLTMKERSYLQLLHDIKVYTWTNSPLHYWVHY